jgi:hypothetical protein
LRQRADDGGGPLVRIHYLFAWLHVQLFSYFSISRCWLQLDSYSSKWSKQG